MGPRDRPHDPERRRVLIRLIAAGTLAAAITAGAALSGLTPSAAEVRGWGDDLGPAAAPLSIPLFALMNFAIPWPVLAAAEGLLFGVVAGTPLALAGVTAAAALQFVIARRVAADQAGRLVPERVRRFDDFLDRRGIVAVIYTRILPGLPYGPVNYLGGITRLKLRDLVAGTLVGAVPKVFVYVALGGTLTDLGSTKAKAALGLWAAVAVAGLVLGRRQLAAERARPEPRSPNLRGVDYFSAVRIYSAIELTIFTALVIAAVGGLGDGTVAVLGWTHGVGWILLCIAVAEGCRKHGFPWTAFAATVSPLGPAGSTAALEWIARSRRVRRAKDPAGQPAGG